MERVTSNSFLRVFHIETSQGTGSCFVIDEAERQFLVTAGHLFQRGDLHPNVRLSSERVTDELELELLRIEPDDADVAVAPLAEPIGPDYPLPPSMVGMVLSQPVFFLGYPYGLHVPMAGDWSNRMPLVKGGLLSAITRDGDGVSRLLIDGHNNPGFSGGPVIFNLHDDTSQPRVGGVVSAYRAERLPVYHKDAPVADVTAAANTGIVIATGIVHVTDAIARYLAGS